MIESFQFENYRGFEQVRLNRLPLINVITGANASGKSALLEAIYLANRATPESLILLNQHRGLGVQMTPGAFGPLMTAPIFRSMWSHYFRSHIDGEKKLATSDEISFEFTDSEKKSRSLRISFAPEGTQPALSAGDANTTSGLFNSLLNNPALGIPALPAGRPLSVTPLFMQRWEGAALGPEDLYIWVNAQGLVQYSPAQPHGPLTFFFGSILNYNEADNVVWFSFARERGESTELVQIIKENFPFVIDLEVSAPTGVPGLYATVANGAVRRLAAVSAGVNKIVSLLLAVGTAKEGVILIDEIENGIFYEKYQTMWALLYRFAKKTRTQLFVTSHSAECLRELVHVMAENVNDFGLLRAERENGTCKIEKISGVAMRAALKGSNEIRGATVGAKRNNT